MDVPGRVLVAFDGSPLATDALAVFPAAEITVLNVVTPLDATMSEGSVLTDEKRSKEASTSAPRRSPQRHASARTNATRR